MPCSVNGSNTFGQHIEIHSTFFKFFKRSNPLTEAISNISFSPSQSDYSKKWTSLPPSKHNSSTLSKSSWLILRF